MTDHTIQHFNNGTDLGYLELNCKKCKSDQDLFDFLVRDWLDASENAFHMRCPNCNHTALVENTTS